MEWMVPFMWIAKSIFYVSLFSVIYIYFGYPLLVYLFSITARKEIRKKEYEPEVTILIAAYNEEKEIEDTIVNKLEIDYPREKLEIIVVSDGSTDQTDEIVKKYQGLGVKLLRQEPRAGKTAAFNRAILEARGEIILFSDANSKYSRDVVHKLVRNFNDESVGYVTGRMIYTNPDNTSMGEGSTNYMNYESFLRRHETKLGSIVGVNGGVDAIRKKLYRPMNPDQLPDFILPLGIVEKGYRVIYEPEAIVYERSLETPTDEYRMRVRVSLRTLWALSDMRRLLSVRKFGLYAWQLWSHKVLRYLCFIFLVGFYLGNMVLWGEGSVYKAVFVVQTGGYLLAIGSLLYEKAGNRIRMFHLFAYFLVLNMASAHAFVKFILGQKQIVWEPRKGI